MLNGDRLKSFSNYILANILLSSHQAMAKSEDREEEKMANFTVLQNHAMIFNMIYLKYLQIAPKETQETVTTLAKFGHGYLYIRVYLSAIFP